MIINIHSQRGFSLIELLVSLIIFSVGLLGVARLQVVSKQSNYESLQRTTASQIANGLLEEMRTNGNALPVYLAVGELGGGKFVAEPQPSCVFGSECTAAQKALHDLWFWERILDGDFENSGGVGTGGLLMPALCINGSAAGGPGPYAVTVVWRGALALTNNNADACGAAGGNFGANNEFRRIVQIPTYIDPNF